MTVSSARGAHTIGVLAMVDVGWTVWAYTDGPDKRVDPDDYPIGGIVVEIEAVDPLVDEYGEIQRDATRLFHTIDHTRLRFHGQVTVHRGAIPERCVNPDSVERWQARRVWIVAGALAETIGPKINRRTGAASNMLEHEDQWRDNLRDAWRLAKTTAGKAQL